MSELPRKVLLETSAIIVGYAMSRLDKEYLNAFHCRTWKEAFQQAAHSLKVRPASFKNLRDEFDPIHSNAREGWHSRPLRPNRQRVMGDLCDLSDEAIVELVQRILVNDPIALAEAVTVLATPRVRIYNVAERLLTGRRAEEYFLKFSQRLVGKPASDIQDVRQTATGFDFAIRSLPDIAIEVKGIRKKRGDILFTDREWKTAEERGDNYWLVIVGNLEDEPIAKTIANPRANLIGRCRYTNTITASWSSTVQVT
jgi:hypothetical protein